MANFIFEIPRPKALEFLSENIKRGATCIKGVCYSADNIPMRFRLYGTIAYILPPKSVAPNLKGTWVSKYMLFMLNPKCQ